MRAEGESKDCERIRTFGDGVRGGTRIVVMTLAKSRGKLRMLLYKIEKKRAKRWITFRHGEWVSRSKAYIDGTHAAALLALHISLQAAERSRETAYTVAREMRGGYRRLTHCWSNMRHDGEGRDACEWLVVVDPAAGVGQRTPCLMSND
jgi:hypothetical protein